MNAWALSLSIALTPLGGVDALKGSVVHAPGVVAGISQERAYTFRDPDTPTDPPAGARTIASPEVCRKHPAVSTKLPLAKGETAVATAHGALGEMGDVTVLLVRSDVKQDDVPSPRAIIRVYEGKRLAGELELESGTIPCSLVLDDFDDSPGNELAVGWISMGAGYTAGATVFRAAPLTP